MTQAQVSYFFFFFFQEALDVLLDVKFQLAANGKPLDPSLPAVPEVAEVPETAGGLQPL